MICNKIILIYHDFLIRFQLRAGHKEICFRQSARKIILIVSCVAKKRSCAKNRIGLQRVQKNIGELKRQIFQTGSENKLMPLLWIKKKRGGQGEDIEYAASGYALLKLFRTKIMLCFVSCFFDIKFLLCIGQTNSKLTIPPDGKTRTVILSPPPRSNNFVLTSISVASW